jgi:hypothetical protein
MEAIALCSAPNCIYSVEQNTDLFKIELRIYMNATCFGHFSGHPQACQYKRLIKEDITRQTLKGRSEAVPPGAGVQADVTKLVGGRHVCLFVI